MAQRTQTRALTEAGMTVGLMMILSLIGVYVPVISSVALLVWPVPAAYLGVKNGTRWAIMATVATILLLMFITGPVIAAGLGLTFGTVGIALCEGFRRQWSASRTFLVTSVAFCIGFVVQFLLSFYIMGVDLFAMYQQIMQESTEQAFRTMESTGYNAIELAEAKANYLAQLSQMQRFLPFIVASAGMLLAYLDIRIAQAILKRLGVQVKPFPPIAEWEMPRVALYVYVLAMLAAYFAAQLPWLPVDLAVNVQVAAMYVIWLQGIAVVFWLGRRYSGLRILRWPVAIAAVFIPLFMALVFFMGLLDMGLNYRKRKGYYGA
ncbi:MAG: YybS family protein [Veillonellaceae bacterium]|nr:YybS family protein [Veillonellaceae bacterium]